MPENAIFVCRRSRTLLMADIAEQLKKNGTIKKACAVHIGDIRLNKHAHALDSFDQVYYDLDMYKPDLSSIGKSRIAELLDRYDDTFYLWNNLFSERGLIGIEQDIYKPLRNPSRDEARALIIKSLHYADSWIDQSRADFLFDISALGLLRLSLHAAASHRNIPFLYHDFARIGERYVIYDDMFHNHKAVLERYNCLKGLPESDPDKAPARKVKQSLKENGSLYVGHVAVSDEDDTDNKGNRTGTLLGDIAQKVVHPFYKQCKVFSSWMKKRKIEKVGLQEGLINYIDDRFRSSDVWTRKTRSNRRRRINTRIIASKQLSRHPELEKCPKVLYTWHVQPENSTSQYAAFKVNQDIVVQNIARVLPLDWIVVVKPHVWTLNKVRPREYELIANLPNVYFADFKTSTPQIIEECDAIVTLTGTVGLEGLALDKPVFYMGDASWGSCDSAHFAQTYEQLGGMLRELDKYKPDSNEVVSYFQAIIDNSMELEDGEDTIRYPEKYVGGKTYKKNIEVIARHIEVKIKSLFGYDDESFQDMKTNGNANIVDR